MVEYDSKRFYFIVEIDCEDIGKYSYRYSDDCDDDYDYEIETIEHIMTDFNFFYEERLAIAEAQKLAKERKQPYALYYAQPFCMSWCVCKRFGTIEPIGFKFIDYYDAES